MNNELNDVLTKIRKVMMSSMKQLTLNKRELHVLLKYINQLECELVEGINNNDIQTLIKYVKGGRHENNN